jgi:hypothetical protein
LLIGASDEDPQGVCAVATHKLILDSWSAPMDDQDFEGTLVLEKLALIDKVDAFFEAIDSDDPQKAAALMRKANVDSETIAIVLKKMAEASE